MFISSYAFSFFFLIFINEFQDHLRTYKSLYRRTHIWLSELYYGYPLQRFNKTFKLYSVSFTVINKIPCTVKVVYKNPLYSIFICFVKTSFFNRTLHVFVRNSKYYFDVIKPYISIPSLHVYKVTLSQIFVWVCTKLLDMYLLQHNE